MSPSPTVYFHGWHVWVIVIGAGGRLFTEIKFQLYGKNEQEQSQAAINQS